MRDFQDKRIADDITFMKSIKEKINFYDDNILNLSLRMNMDSQTQANKVIGLIVEKMSIIQKFNNIADAILSLNFEERNLYDLYYVKNEESIVIAGILNISQRTLFRKLSDLRQKYYRILDKKKELSWVKQIQNSKRTHSRNASNWYYEFR